LTVDRDHAINRAEIKDQEAKAMLWIQDQGQGPPLVLLHAVGTSGTIWWQHLPRLARRFRVLTVDLPGHGKSPKPTQPLSIESMAAVLYETLQSQALLPAHLVGLSLGGMVAQMLAVNQPSSVATLTLCDTICEANPAAADILEARARAVEKSGMAATLRPTLERWFAPAFSDRHPEVTAVVEKLLLQADPMINAQTWRAIAGFNVTSRLKTLARIPALVVNGSLDTSIAPDMGKHLAELLGAELVELAGCAHMAPLEAPGKFMDILEPFLLAHAPGSKPNHF
jgi:3-oxoadipate enol-lactonase